LVDTITFETETNSMAGGELLARIQQHQQNLKPSQDEKIIGEAKKRDIVQHCHACRQVILASEMNKHLKTCLSQKRKTQQGSAQVG
jgi:acetyl-CoA carboxylase beta subunit